MIICPRWHFTRGDDVCKLCGS